MLKRLFFHSLISLGTLWLADKFVPGVDFHGSREILIFCGLVWGFANAFIAPILERLAFAFQFLTLGLFSFVINAAILWFLDIAFPELDIIGIIPLLLTSLIVTVGIKLLYPINKD